MTALVADRIVRVLKSLGFSLFAEALTDQALLDGLQEFREHLGGRLSITLLRSIGRPFEVDAIDRNKISEAIKHLADDNVAGPSIVQGERLKKQPCQAATRSAFS